MTRKHFLFIQGWYVVLRSWFLPEEFNHILGEECNLGKSGPTQKT